jgi:DNA-binding transcriptional ArsR family regulator
MSDDRARVDSVFSALSDPTRREVLRMLAEGDGVTATEIAGRMPVSRQAVSKHLAALDEAGLVTTERAGRERRYRLTPEPLADAMSWMVSVGAEWDQRLVALRTHLRGRGWS